MPDFKPGTYAALKEVRYGTSSATSAMVVPVYRVLLEYNARELWQGGWFSIEQLRILNPKRVNCADNAEWYILSGTKK